MPGIKDDANGSEGEEMEQETPESEKTSNEYSDSSTGSGGSDDDDSSEMDEEDCERRRAECLDDMADLERQFMHLKEQLYQERAMQMAIKLEQVMAGDAMEYLQPLEDLRDNMRIRTEVSGILRELKLANIKNKYEAEQLASRQNFESEKALLWDSIKIELEDKIRRLEEDRNSVDITSDLWNEQINHRKNKRKVDPLNLDKRKKPVTISGPYIVYMLHENEILEDWTTVRKAMKAAKQKNEYEFAPPEQRTHAHFADGKLFYEGTWYHKGDCILLENKVESPVLAHIMSVNTSEVVIKRRDGNRTRLNISDLQSGKYDISHSPV